MIGTILDGKYRIEAALGKGGMGAVYRATHLHTDRTVAVKVIDRRFLGDDDLLERFKREARAAGRLRSPNIVDVTDFGIADDGFVKTPYLVMEYLEGCSLEALLHEIPTPALPWVIDVFEQVCLAVDEAHTHGILHRDLKPANVWLEPDRLGRITAKVLDFGLARLDTPPGAGIPSAPADVDLLALYPSTIVQGSQPGPAGGRAVAEGGEPSHDGETLAVGTGEPGQTDGTPLTLIGTVMGTPAFMAPEQAQGARVDARADVYGLGAVLYTMLTGRPPFRGLSFEEVVEKQRAGRPEPPQTINPSVPKRVSELVMQALATDPAERPQTPAILAAMVRGRSDGVGMLVRRAVVFGTTHLPIFLKVFLAVYVPVFALQALLRAGRIELSFGRDAYHILASNAAAFAVLLAESVAVFLVRGISVVVLAQLLVAAMRPPSLEPAFRILNERLPGSVMAMATFLVVNALPFNLATHLFAFSVGRVAVLDVSAWSAIVAALAGLGVVGGLFVVFARLSLYPIVFVVDGLTGVGGARRAWEITGVVPSLALKLAAVDMALWGVEVLVEKIAFPAIVGETQGLVVERVAFFIAFQAIVAPTLAIAYAMLYVNLRRARGETARNILSHLAVSVDLTADFTHVVDHARSRSAGGGEKRRNAGSTRPGLSDQATAEAPRRDTR